MNHSTDAGAADGWFGAKFSRKEDQRLITGRGRYIADIVVPGMLHLVFVRSQVAHARIKKHRHEPGESHARRRGGDHR